MLLEAREARERARAEAREQRREAREQVQQARQLLRSGSEGQAGGAGGCQLAVEASSALVAVGEGVSLSGTLTCPEGVSPGERVVTVFRTGGGLERSEVGTATTQVDGSYQLTVPALQVNSMLSVRSPHARPARVPVKVTPRVSLSDPSAGAVLAAVGGRAHAASSVRATFSGTVAPVEAGAPLALQTSYDPSGGYWRTVALGRVDQDGGYALSHSFRSAGQVWVRVIVRPGHHLAPAASEAVRYEVAGRQNPALTIYSSSPQAPFGEEVTISGVAAAAPGQTVELLARPAGGAFAVLATASTDASGHYSFKQTPLQRTYYRVQDASTQSTTLYQTVSYALSPEAPPASASAGQPVAFTGTLAPAAGARLVQLERSFSSGVNFFPIASAAADGASYSIAHTFAAAGTYLLRVKVQAGACCEGAASAPFTLQVTP